MSDPISSNQIVVSIIGYLQSVADQHQVKSSRSHSMAHTMAEANVSFVLNRCIEYITAEFLNNSKTDDTQHSDATWRYRAST